MPHVALLKVVVGMWHDAQRLPALSAPWCECEVGSMMARSGAQGCMALQEAHCFRPAAGSSAVRLVTIETGHTGLPPSDEERGGIESSSRTWPSG